MKAMQCEHAAGLIGAYLDQELDAGTRREVSAHLSGCAACATLADDDRATSRRLAALGREPAPAHLAERLRARLAAADSHTLTLAHRAAHAVRLGPGWRRQAAVLLLACGATSLATALAVSRMDATAALERDIAAAHVRSLLQDSPTQ